jgi:hypothetical protein
MDEDNAILTQSELDQQTDLMEGTETSPPIEPEVKSKGKKKKEEPAVPVTPIEPEVKKSIDRIFECPFAPLGEANISIVHNFEGSQNAYKLKLKDKCYTVFGDMEAGEKRKLVAALEKEGFRDITVSNVPAPYVFEPGELIYRMRHPEFTEKSRLNGSIGLVLVGDDGQPMLDKDGKQITKNVTMSGGIVTTDDKLVYEALLKAGFYGGGSPKEEVQ